MHTNMNDKNIDELINKALQEEQALPEGLSRRLEEQINAWAASILLCIGFFQYDVPSYAPDRLHDTYTNPEDAAVAAEKALLLLSHNLNKGISQVNDAGQEIDKVNNILNKHLND